MSAAKQLSSSAGLLEVIITGLDDAVQAEAAGADRLEIVCAPKRDGLTPPADVVRGIVRACRIPAMVMLRPHDRSFVHDAADLAAVREACAMARDAGAHGIVFGALTPEGAIDEAALEAVLRWSEGLSFTFHRAFDAAADLDRAFDVLGRYRRVIARVLTSGGRASAIEGAATLHGLVRRWRDGEGVEPMPGAGIGPETLGPLGLATGARQFHVGSRARVGRRFDGPIDPQSIALMRAALA